MPLSGAQELHRVHDRLRAVRASPVLKYGIAVAAVTIATLLRLSVSGSIPSGVPFITYFPVVIAVTLVCGLWPGLVATALSAAAAWYLFLSPTESGPFDPSSALTLAFFITVCLINIGLVMFLSMAIEAVMAEEENVRVLIESAPNGIVVVDGEGRIKLVNASAERLFGYQHSELLGKPVELLVPEGEAARHRVERAAYQKRPMTRAMGAGRDLMGRRKDGSEFPLEIGLNPVVRNGKRAVLATVLDISDRKRAQESQKLLVRELQHRTKNLIAVIQAVVGRSLDESKTMGEAKEAFTGRLQALARSYELLVESAWEGASLSEVLRRQLEGFSDRIEVRGCDVVVTPSAAQQFALIIHELATNAAKYGALSQAGGRVAIEGVRENGVLWFRWRESGGPPVSRPTRKGFGSVLLVDAARPWGNTVHMTFAPQGLSYELAMTLETIEAGNAGRARPMVRTGAGAGSN